METIVYRNAKGFTEKHQGLWVERAAGVVLMHTKHSQTLIPWGQVVRIEQTINPSGLTMFEVNNKQLTSILRRN